MATEEERAKYEEVKAGLRERFDEHYSQAQEKGLEDRKAREAAARELYKEDPSIPADIMADVADLDKTSAGRAKGPAASALKKQERLSQTPGGEGGVAAAQTEKGKKLDRALQSSRASSEKRAQAVELFEDSLDTLGQDPDKLHAFLDRLGFTAPQIEAAKMQVFGVEPYRPEQQRETQSRDIDIGGGYRMQEVRPGMSVITPPQGQGQPTVIQTEPKGQDRETERRLESLEKAIEGIYERLEKPREPQQPQYIEYTDERGNPVKVPYTRDFAETLRAREEAKRKREEAEAEMNRFQQMFQMFGPKKEEGEESSKLESALQPFREMINSQNEKIEKLTRSLEDEKEKNRRREMDELKKEQDRKYERLEELVRQQGTPKEGKSSADLVSEAGESARESLGELGNRVQKGIEDAGSRVERIFRGGQQSQQQEGRLGLSPEEREKLMQEEDKLLGQQGGE